MMDRVINILNQEYSILSQIDTQSIPDCFVDTVLKIGGGHGERKFYVSSKVEMCKFYNDNEQQLDNSKTLYNCFFLKKDLQLYLRVMKKEFLSPSLPYRILEEDGAIKKDGFGLVNSLEQWYGILQQTLLALDNEPIRFKVSKQMQIKGDRGYINAPKEEANYDLLRRFLIPILTSVQVYKLEDKQGSIFYYWRPYPDFEAMANPNRLLVVFYQNTKVTKAHKTEAQIKKEQRIRKSRINKYKALFNTQATQCRKGQSQYRSDLIEEMGACIFTGIKEPALLIASHIMPWAMCQNDEDRTNKNNGILLSPLYDRLFDRGFITFLEDGKIDCSSLIPEEDWNRIEIDYNKQYLSDIYLKSKGRFLEYHRNNVFHK